MLIVGKRQDEAKAEQDPAIRGTLFKALEQMVMTVIINMVATSGGEIH